MKLVPAAVNKKIVIVLMLVYVSPTHPSMQKHKVYKTD
jgi:hypothetical protein